MNNLPFVSGSQAYGTPTEKSDVDLVLMMDFKTAQWLYNVLHDASNPSSATIESGSLSIIHGKLNLICCWEEKIYNIWKDGTKILIGQAPVTRPFAQSIFDALRLNRL